MTQVAGTAGTVAVTHETPWYVARCLDVDVVSHGETVDEALANLGEALGLYFEAKDLPDSLEASIITTAPLRESRTSRRFGSRNYRRCRGPASY